MEENYKGFFMLTEVVQVQTHSLYLKITFCLHIYCADKCGESNLKSKFFSTCVYDFVYK